MMQSLLSTGTASVKNNDLKVSQESDVRSDKLRRSKLAEQQHSFAKVMQDNIDKEQTRRASRAASQEADREIRHTDSDQELTTKKNDENVQSDITDPAQKEPNITQESSEKEKQLSTNNNKKSVNKENIEMLSTDAELNAEVLEDMEDKDKLVNISDFKKYVAPSEIMQDEPENQEDTDLLDIENKGLILDNDQVDNVETITLQTVDHYNEIKKSAENTFDTEEEQSEISVQKSLDNEQDNADIATLNFSGSNDAKTISSTETADESLHVEENILSNGQEQVINNEAVIVEGREDSHLFEDDLSLSKHNELLSQIEAAQKINTNVKNKTVEDVENFAEAGKIDSAAVQANAIIKTDINTETPSDDENELNTKKLMTEMTLTEKSKVTSDNVNKFEEDVDVQSKFKGKAEGELLIKDEATIASTNEDLPSSSKVTEKVDTFSTALKTENSFNHTLVQDANSPRPNQVNAAQLDKLVAFNQQQPNTNNLLQEPLDIQSKQAAAMMGERVMMMISQGKQEVHIRLDPAELGSMLIKLQVQQDQVQLNIQTQAGLSKDIIEQNMPRLREQLAQQGIQLNEANVQQQSSQQQQSDQQRSNRVNTGVNQRFNGEEIANDQKNILIPSKIPLLEQGIDYYV